MKYLPLACLSLALAGCSTLAAVTGGTVTQQDVIIAANAFDAVEATATVYAKRPRCPMPAGVICSDRVLLAKIKPAILAGRADRNALEKWTAGGPQPVTLASLYSGLVAATKTLSAIFPSH